MKQQHRTLYLILVLVFALALPLFDILEYIHRLNLYHNYQFGYLIWFNKPIIIPFCSFFLGYFLIQMLDVRNPNKFAFRFFMIILILYIISMFPWSLYPLFPTTMSWSAYHGTITFLINEVDFLPAIFVIVGMGLAYFRKGKTDKSLSTEQTDE